MPTQLRYELKCRHNPATPSGAKVLFAPTSEHREQTLTRRPPHGVHPRDDLHGLGAELISEVVEIEKAQVTERAYPPGITNRR